MSRSARRSVSADIAASLALLALASTLVLAVEPTSARAQSSSERPADSAPAALTPADVVATDPGDSGSRITLEGEAIGEDLRAGSEGRWVNVLGGGVAVGVWMSEEDADRIQTWGDYHHVGDLVRITGTVNTACDLHAGEFDVHAEEVEILEPGYERPERIEPWKGVVGLIGIAVGVIELVVYRRSREVA